jgi:choline dehydrogenase-like flavoprotein
VGGSSAINLLALIYPNKASLDSWAELGNDGWDWEHMAPYFQKFLTLNVPDNEVKEVLDIDYIKTSIQGSGPVQGSFPDMKDPIQKAWVDTFRTLHLKSNQDPTLGESIGGYTSAGSITASKERSHPGVAYYAPAKDRPNLHLITAAHVEKVVFTKDSTHCDAVASGVQFLHQGISTFVKASKEVLLSSGVFGSPQVLELSGIGSRELLEQHKTPVLYGNHYVGGTSNVMLPTGDVNYAQRIYRITCFVALSSRLMMA